MKLSVKELRQIIKETISNEFLLQNLKKEIETAKNVYDKNRAIEKYLDVYMKNSSHPVNSPDWHIERGDEQDRLISPLDYSLDEINLKRTIRNLGLLGALAFAPAAHANPEKLVSTETDSSDVVSLENEEGEEHNFKKLIKVTVDGNQYYALELLEYDGEYEAGTIFLFEYKINPKSGEEIFIEIESDELWEKVKNEVEENLEDEE